MHIPDGWLDLLILLITWAITLLVLSFSLSKITKDLERVSSIGAIASVIFVAQMFNFPIAGGTTGHLLGGALAVYVVGLPGAIIAMFSVLFVQAFVFADGGIFSLGANMLNMGIVTSLVAYFIKTFRNRDNMSEVEYYSRIYLSAFLSVVVASIFATMELVFSNKTTLTVGLPLILGYHILIGLVECVITVGINYYLKISNFPLEQTNKEEKISFFATLKSTNKPLFGLGLLLFFLSIVPLFAVNNPDGLASAALQLFPSANESSFQLGIANDYDFLGLGSFLGTILSAFLGILLILGFYFIPASFLNGKNKVSRD